MHFWDKWCSRALIALLLTLDESQKMNAGEQQQATQYYALKFEKKCHFHIGWKFSYSGL